MQRVATRVKVAVSKVSKLLNHRIVSNVADRAFAPLRQDRVVLEHKAQRLANIPAVQIDLIDNGPFDHIADRLKREIVSARPDVEKAHVVIAVRRWEAPCARTGFHRHQQAHAVLARHTGETGLDIGAHCGRDG